MEQSKTILSTSEQIERARDGRSQRWLVGKLAEAGIVMTEVDFSNKKTGNKFTDEEIEAISKILGVQIMAT